MLLFSLFASSMKSEEDGNEPDWDEMLTGELDDKESKELSVYL